MQKNVSIIIILIIILTSLAVSVSWGQYIPNAPFKAKYLKAPDFTLKDTQGKTFKLSAVKGKPVLIFFGTTWCPGCRAEIPIYKKVFETYVPRGLEVIYINIMESAKKVTRFVKANSLPYRTLLDENGVVADEYGVMGVPTVMLIDQNGYIVKIGHSSSEMQLEKVLRAE